MVTKCLPVVAIHLLSPVYIPGAPSNDDRSHSMRTVLALALLLILTAGNGANAQTCLPGIVEAYTGVHSAEYQALALALGPAAGPLSAQLTAVADAPTYDVL